MADPRHFCCSLVAALALAGVAQAETPSLAALNAAVRPALAPQGTAAPPLRPDARAFQHITMMKIAIAQRLTSDGLTGSLGLLCGRQPNRDISGGAGAFDKDPEGKFVGAQLSRTF